MLATDALTNFFRYRRELLDSAGFVIFPDLFNSLTSIDKSLVWPSMNTTMDNDLLYRSAEAYVAHWLERAPTSQKTERGDISTNEFLCWSGIRNTQVDETRQIEVSSRLMHTKYAESAYYEDSEEK